MSRDRIAAVAFLTEDNLKAIGTNLKRVYRVADIAPFEDLLGKLDDAASSRSAPNSRKGR